jgi:3',5'-cyclic AMP phosphodiesterase CpdA
MNRMIAFEKPDFVVIAGDLAYTVGTKNLLKGPKWALSRWQTFLRDLQRSLGQDGKLIPMLPLVGNHDVNKPKNRTDKPELFYEIFTFPEMGKSYRSLDFGDYLSLVMLDTGHTWPIVGDQTAWLEKTLQAKRSVPYLLMAYHVAAYPSYYPFIGASEELIRKNWVPLFEKYQVPFAFEHHNHTFKRTHPIKEGKVNPSGVTYLGDGSWGVPPRQVNTPEKIWYLAKSASVNSCYIVTLTEEKCLIEAKNTKGEVIDQVERASKASLAPVSSE